MKPNLIQLLWEVPAIILAIFLALAVDNCNDNRKDRAVMKRSLAAISNEIKDNQTSLQDNIQSNDSIKQSLIITLDSLRKFDRSIVSVSIHYEHSILSNAAWESAILNGSTRHFDPKQLQDLATIYELQEMYYDMGLHYFQQMASMDFHREKSEKARIEAGIAQITITNDIAKGVLNGYQEYFKDYGRKEK